MKLPIYIARPVLSGDVIDEICQRLQLEDPLPDPHVTLICSQRPVSWSSEIFTPRSDEVEIPPQTALLCRFGRDGEYISLVIGVDEVANRHEQVRSAGASHTNIRFRPHITLAMTPDAPLPVLLSIDRPIILGPEFRKVPEFY